MNKDRDAHLGAVAEEPPVIHIQLSKRERQAIRQCEIMLGDEEGPKGRCQNFAAGTAYTVSGQQLRVCDPHRGMLKYYTLLAEAAKELIKEPRGNGEFVGYER